MRAVAFEKPGDLEVLQRLDVPIPTIGDDEVLVQVKACALNHLDVWVRKGLPTAIPMPHIGGCETAGVVAEIGKKVQAFSKGQRVLIAPGQSCNACHWCSQALDCCCEQFQVHGYHSPGRFRRVHQGPGLRPDPDQRRPGRSPNGPPFR